MVSDDNTQEQLADIGAPLRPMSDEQLDAIRARVEACDYAHIGNWGKEPEDAEWMLEALLADNARLRAQVLHMGGVLGKASRKLDRIEGITRNG